jgi:TP901 family phage tail tape measure protein
MTDRTVKVNLVAQVNGYLSGMEQAARKTREVGTEAEKLAAKRQGFETLGRSMLVFGAVAAAATLVAVKKFAEFDQAMSNVSAATHESTANMGLLRDAALEAGQATVFTATEAAGAVEELGKAGVSTADILSGGLSGSLALASAGQLEIADAAQLAAIAMKQFNLEGSDIPHIADLLAAGAGKSVGSVGQLGEALNQAGLVANQTGLTIEETTGALSSFADAGLLGSDSGTAFKSMLQRLTPQSGEAAAKMAELNISAYDAQGNFIGLEKFAGNLQNGLKGLTDEQRNSSLATIFGSDAVRAASRIYELGATGIKKYIDQVDDTGYAADTARRRLDNLAGDVEKLGGAFDTALIQSGSAGNDVLRTTVQLVTDLIGGFSDLPVEAQNTALIVAAVAAAVALTGGAAFIAVPKIAQFRAAISDLGTTVGKTALSAGAVGLAITAVVTILGAFATANADAKSKAEALADTIDKQTGAFTDNSRAITADDLQKSGALKTAKNLGITTEQLTEAYLGNADALDVVNKRVKDAADPNSEYSKSLRENGTDLFLVRADALKLAGTLKEGSVVVKQAKDRTDELSTATDDAGDSMQTLTSNVDGTTTSLEDLMKQIDAFNGQALTVRDTARNFQASLDDFDQALIDNGNTFDINEEAGRKNQAALDDIAKSASDSADAIVAAGGGYDEFRASLESSRDALLHKIEDTGVAADEAQRLVDAILAIPPATEFKVTADISDAQKKINSLRAALGIKPGADGSFGNGLGVLKTNANGNMHAYANGGFASGIYAGRAGGIHKFAEPETKWEAYISGKAGQRQRNLGIWADAGRRLGAGDYMQAPAATGTSTVQAAAPALDGVSIAGTLDLGNGLTGLVKGVLKQEVSKASAAQFGRS